MGVGLDTVGADTGGLVGAFDLKKTAASLVPAVSSAATDALTDKPKDGGDKPKSDNKSSGGSSGSENGFLSKVIVAPVRVWHALVGVVAAGGGIYLWKRK